MYQDLGLISAFRIPMRALVHFLLMVRKGYRDPPYHNWDHAFSVMHHSYLLAKHLQLNKKLRLASNHYAFDRKIASN